MTVDVSTSASAANPWSVQIQKPEPSGQVTAHIEGNISFIQQFQIAGLSDTGSCTYSTSNLPLMGEAQNDVFTVEGSHQFTKTAGIALCREFATLEGKFQLEDGAANPVVVHMT